MWFTGPVMFARQLENHLGYFVNTCQNYTSEENQNMTLSCTLDLKRCAFMFQRHQRHARVCFDTMATARPHLRPVSYWYLVTTPHVSSGPTSFPLTTGRDCPCNTKTPGSVSDDLNRRRCTTCFPQKGSVSGWKREFGWKITHMTFTPSLNVDLTCQDKTCCTSLHLGPGRWRVH